MLGNLLHFVRLARLDAETLECVTSPEYAAPLENGKERINAALAEYFEPAPRLFIRCGETGAAGGETSLAERQQEERRMEEERLRRETLADPITRAAMELFGEQNVKVEVPHDRSRKI
ncbi:MAG: hypothetical protein GMKNLPBB_01768 [Myxococcota bacterium]|nr:hypothetical protein [Myxococcota bacterium]